jgi:integrase
VDAGFCRDTVNRYTCIIKQMFTWGCEEEIVPAETAGALRMVQALQQGRTTAREYRNIQPVSDDVLEKTLQYIKEKQIRDMVRVQRLISGRPQDIHHMRLCDIDRSGEIWRYKPFTHKTAYRGKLRELAIGPKAQAILASYIEATTDPKRFLFPRPKTKSYEHYYSGKIRTACKQAGVPSWSPNQLRHAAGTEIRAKFGLEFAQACLGHREVD